MSLKNNNFFKWLSNQENIPIHISTKHSKDKIPPSLKKLVWTKYFNDFTTHKCTISWCNNILDNTIKNGWHAGHIISEYNGGKTILENLKPICKTCNSEMSTKNWYEHDPT